MGTNMTELTIWDVQHGSAAYIKSPEGQHIIVDAGMGSYNKKDSVFSPLYHLWNVCGVKQIDCAILTHPHGDHIGDIDNLIKLRPKVFRHPQCLGRSDIITSDTRQSDIHLYEQYLDFDKGHWDPYDDISIPINYGGLEIQTFVANDCRTSDLNNQSIVSVFRYANCKVVIPGDNENPSFKELMLRHDFKEAISNADVLVAPHHGRDSGFHYAFVKHVSPQITIISDSSKKDTSAVEDYGRLSRGCSIFRRDYSLRQHKKTVSTYNDGEITILLDHHSKPSLRTMINGSSGIMVNGLWGRTAFDKIWAHP